MSLSVFSLIELYAPLTSSLIAVTTAGLEVVASEG